MPPVQQSSRTVWSKVPGRTAALNPAMVFASAAASISSSAASSGIERALSGGYTGGMNLPMDFASMIENPIWSGWPATSRPHMA